MAVERTITRISCKRLRNMAWACGLSVIVGSAKYLRTWISLRPRSFVFGRSSFLIEYSVFVQSNFYYGE